MCLYFDFKLKKCHFYPAGVLRGNSNWLVKIFCAYLHFKRKYYSYFIMLGVYIYLILVTDIIFGVKKKLKHFNCFRITERYFGHLLPVILYPTRARAGQLAHYSKCLNGVYKAYTINHISYKKL